MQTLDTPPHRRAHEKERGREGERERENRKVHIGKDIYYNSYPRCLQKIGVQSPPQPSRTRCLVKGKKRVSPHSYRLEGGRGSWFASRLLLLLHSRNKPKKKQKTVTPCPPSWYRCLPKFAPANAMQSCESRDSCSKQPAYYRDTRDQ